MTNESPGKSKWSGDVDLVLWPSAMLQEPLSVQLDAAAAGQFTGLAVAPVVIRRELRSGLRIADLLELAAERGVALTHLDGVSTWAPKWFPTEGNRDLNDAMRARFDISAAEALDLGEALGLKSVVAVGAFDQGALPLAEVIEDFAVFCDAAKSHGMCVDLEFIPLWGIRELPMAWEIIRTADRGNTGIVVDTWHLQMGTTDFERDMSLLETIPGKYLTSVQLADAVASDTARTLVDHLAFRTFAGAGHLAITRMLATIAGRGGLKDVGPEVVGTVLNGLTPQEFGMRSAKTSREAIALASDSGPA